MMNPEFFYRFGAFQKAAFSPVMHSLFAFFWCLSLLGSLGLAAGQAPWAGGSYLLIAPLTLYCVLFFLRAADEIKDCEYDKRFNPDRPLASGMVSARDVWLFMLILGCLAVIINLGYDSPAKWIILADVLYGALLIYVERLFPLVGKKIFLNLLFTYPVNIALSVYLLTLHQAETHTDITAAQVLVVVAYAAAFLHFELGRKTAWPQHSQPHENLYSNAIGPLRSIFLTWLMAVLGVGLYLIATAPWQLSGIARYTGWLPLITLIPASLVVVKFLNTKSSRKNLRGACMHFLIGFYLTAFLHGVVVAVIG